MENRSYHKRGDHKAGQRPFFRSPEGIGLIVLAVVAGFYLWTEHEAHLFGALPFLLLLACPLMHVFMHRGRGGHGNDKPKGG